jgi:hypothetical protein
MTKSCTSDPCRDLLNRRSDAVSQKVAYLLAKKAAASHRLHEIQSRNLSCPLRLSQNDKMCMGPHSDAVIMSTVLMRQHKNSSLLFSRNSLARLAGYEYYPCFPSRNRLHHEKPRFVFSAVGVAVPGAPCL